MKRTILCLLAAGCLFLSSLTPASALTPSLDIVSDTYCVMDAASGQVLIEKNKDKIKAPASITKILTVGIALERGGDPDDRFVLDYKTCHSLEPGATHIALTEGEGVLLCTILDEGAEKVIDLALWQETTLLGGALVSLFPDPAL